MVLEELKQDRSIRPFLPILVNIHVQERLSPQRSSDIPCPPARLQCSPQVANRIGPVRQAIEPREHSLTKK
jgi:hypothetical protein